MMRATRHLHHSPALHLGRDQRRRPGRHGGRPNLSVAVVAPGKELPVCGRVHKGQGSGNMTTAFSSVVYKTDDCIRLL